MTKVVSIRRNTPRAGAPRPEYALEPSIADLFSRYERILVGKFVEDPLGTRVWFRDYNFPKLIQLSFRGTKAKASVAVNHLRRRGSEADYSFDAYRAKTLFWIPDVIQNADSIYVNGHKRIAGDQVYVKRYAKAGSPLKVVFTQIDDDLNQRIVTTSFQTDDEGLKRFVNSQPMWSAKNAPSEEVVLDIAATQEET